MTSAPLSPSDQEFLQALLHPSTGIALQKRLAELSLHDFLTQAWEVIEPGTPFVDGWHIQAMCQHLEAVSRGEIRNLVITVPPGSTKSIITCVMFPTWTWVNYPSTRFLCAANDDSLVIRDAVACRRLIESDWYKERWGDVFALTSDQNVKSWYENSRRGHRTSTTVAAKVTGKKGDILVVDDANDALQVESDAKRNAVNDWWDQAFYNRVNNFKTGRRVIIGQRTHHEDLIGHVLKSGEFEHLNIPEEYDSGRKCATSIWSDPRTQDGELMRPERFGPEERTKAIARLGTRGYAAQHGQNPTPKEGNLFKSEWFRYYTIDEHGYWHFGSKKYPVEHIQGRFITVDTAASEKELIKDDPDYTAISTWGYTPCGLLVWLGCSIDRVEVPDIPPKLASPYERWQVHCARIEGGGQKAAVQLCRRHKLPHGGFMNIVEIVREKGQDKVARSADAQAMLEAGRIWLPAEGEQPGFPLAAVEAQVLRFPQAGHDDIVDTLSDAARELTRRDDENPEGMVVTVLRRGLG